MSIAYIKLAAVGLMLGQAGCGMGQTVPVKTYSVQRTQSVNAQRPAPGRRLQLNTARGYRQPAASIIDRFATDGTTYQTVYSGKEAEARQNRCQGAMAARQTIVDQFTLIDSLLHRSAFSELSQARQRGRLPIVDSLRLVRGRVEYISMYYNVPFAPDCDIPAIDTSAYRALRALRDQNRLVIRVYTSSAMVVSRLPALTGNARHDAQSYLAAISNQLIIYRQRLQTTLNEYLAYENKRKLATDEARLIFRKEFYYCILCDVDSH